MGARGGEDPAKGPAARGPDTTCPIPRCAGPRGEDDRLSQGRPGTIPQVPLVAGLSLIHISEPTRLALI
eukprot:7993890-Alexandrium_andersonii.AAC.1